MTVTLPVPNDMLRLGSGLRKERLQARHLFVRQPEKGVIITPVSPGV